MEAYVNGKDVLVVGDPRLLVSMFKKLVVAKNVELTSDGIHALHTTFKVGHGGCVRFQTIGRDMHAAITGHIPGASGVKVMLDHYAIESSFRFVFEEAERREVDWDG